MPTQVIPKKSKPEDWGNIEVDPKKGTGRIWCYDTEGNVVKVVHSDIDGRDAGVIETIKTMGLRPVLDILDQTLHAELYDWTCRTHETIFRYFFRYPSSERDLVHSFCAAVRVDWSSTVRNGRVPSAWNEQQADNGEYLLEYDATLSQAIQYGREEPIAQRVNEFGNVDFAKMMSPAINWDGMTLTDSRDGTDKTFAPGDLHLTDDTSLEDQIHTKVTRSDLVSHWELSFS